MREANDRKWRWKLALSPRSLSSLCREKNKCKGLEFRNDLLDTEGKIDGFSLFYFWHMWQEQWRSPKKQVTTTKCSKMLERWNNLQLLSSLAAKQKATTCCSTTFLIVITLTSKGLAISSSFNINAEKYFLLKCFCMYK